MTHWIALSYSPFELRATLKGFYKKVIQHESVKAYALSEEYPDDGKMGDEITHFHGVIQTTQDRANFRKRVLKNINKEFPDDRDIPEFMLDTEEHRVAKTPVEVPLGYIFKQHGKYITDMDITKEYVERAIKIYEKFKKDKQHRPSLKDALSLNEFMNCVLCEHIDSEVNRFEDEIFQRVFTQKKKLLPYSVFAKINKALMTSYVNLYLADETYKK